LSSSNALYLKGSPSEKGLYLDAQAAFEYVDGRDDLDSSKIIVFGRSLGRFWNPTVISSQFSHLCFMVFKNFMMQGVLSRLI